MKTILKVKSKLTTHIILHLSLVLYWHLKLALSSDIDRIILNTLINLLVF